MLNYVVSDRQDLRNNSVINIRNGFNGYKLPLRPLSSIDTLVVHHDAEPRPVAYSSIARYEAQARMHSGQYPGEAMGMHYHMRIDNAGQFFLCQPFERITYASGNYDINKRSVAVCLDGYFHPPHNQRPTREQFECLSQILGYLSSVGINIQRIRFIAHREVPSPTACAGDKLVPHVAQYRNTGDLAIPSDVAYAFPEYQPKPEAPKPPTPTPMPVPQLPKYEKYGPVTLVAREEVTLKSIQTNKTIKTFPAGTEFLIVQKTSAFTQTFYITEYSAAKGIHNGVVGNLTPKTIEDKPSDHAKDISELKGEVAALRLLVDRILLFLESIFKSFRR